MKLFVLRHGSTAESDTDVLRELGEECVAVVEYIVDRCKVDLNNVVQIYSSAPSISWTRFN